MANRSLLRIVRISTISPCSPYTTIFAAASIGPGRPQQSRSIHTRPPFRLIDLVKQSAPAELNTFFKRTKERSRENTELEIEEGRQLRKTNLGETLDILIRLLPNLQHEHPPPSLLSSNIQLRFFPKTHPGLPTIRGKTAYLATWRVAQWILPFVVLGPIDGFAEIADTAADSAAAVTKKSDDKGVQGTLTSILGLANRTSPDHRKGNIVFKIISMRIINEDNDIDDDILGNVDGVDEYASEPATKLIVRWQTSFVPATNSAATATKDLDDGRVASIVTGLFTFEFDRDGKILVHSVDDLEEIRTQQTAGSKSLKKLAEVVARRHAGRDEEEGQVVANEDERRHGVPRHIA
ncbi:hypothetical protein POJ06DRAFT_134887 [Lipomyces tetrasporus]|uniref:Uncharacterized protein n=1 Tax=Lipomyces tetrasporus TaxID=54092 RepID=A0AAD7QQB7_9ASCO|nr:uncharacterized protein POJ06DRAFT_134887 [Lipomyces tetrasporus]KAJ8099434.1 hypothetical protein POJ06DRAFT_134887 [Lipomyces tetrasporus]